MKGSVRTRGGGGQSGVSRALGVTGLQWDSNDMLAEHCVHGAAETLIGVNIRHETWISNDINFLL